VPAAIWAAISALLGREFFRVLDLEGLSF